MKKRIVASLLTVAMAMGLLAGCGKESAKGTDTTTVSNETEDVVINGITYKKEIDMTDEEITLRYFHFDQDETVQYLAERFMEIYPNITVEPVYENVQTYMTTLTNMMAEGDVPDVIMYSDCDTALTNQWLGDISGFWDTDEETKQMASTINDCGIGKFGTTARYAAPVKFFPGVMLIDRNVLKTLNVEVPGQDWTWSDMIQIIKDCTQSEKIDGMKYYGCGVYNRLDSYYGIAAAQTIQGEFGFNGKTFDLSTWAVGEQEFSDLKLSGYVAPDRESDANEAWCGDYEAWCGATGHVALFTEAFWTFQGTWNTEAFEQYNLDIIPYVVPAVSEEDASADHHSIATIDFGGVTDACIYKREAYELLKFMGFGIDGWKTRIELYNDETKTNASGLALKHDVMPAPITTNEEVWDGYLKMYTAGMDDEHVQLWKNYFQSCLQPIPYGWVSIAGYWNYCDQYFNKIGIHNLVDTGKAKAADYQEEGTRKANFFHAEAMLSYFGKDGYDVLSDEDIAFYQSIIDNEGAVVQ